MTIQIESIPISIGLIGNPKCLEEKTERNEEEEKLDYPSDSNIEHRDLVFTLKQNNGKYCRSYARLENRGLYVVSNLNYFRSVREANLKKVVFDLILGRSIPLEKLMEDFGLEFSPRPVKREYFERFLFFLRTPTPPEFADDKLLWNSNNKSLEFSEANCLAYKILIDGNYIRTASFEHELVARLFNENGFLRSIDGIKDKSWSLGRYIS